MIKDAKCGVCGKNLGKVHGADVNDLVSAHIIREHPDVAAVLGEFYHTKEVLSKGFREISGGLYLDKGFYFRGQSPSFKREKAEREAKEAEDKAVPEDIAIGFTSS